MAKNNFSIPTVVTIPRCFVLESAINVSQAYAQATEHKGNVFDSKTVRSRSVLRFGRKQEINIDIKLLHRRWVPFWNVKSRSFFKYTRLKEYWIDIHDPDAESITLQGSDKSGNHAELIYQIDQTESSKGVAKFTGVEKYNTRRELLEWIDSYTPTQNWSPRQVAEQQRFLQNLALQNREQVKDLEGFAEKLTLDGRPVFSDSIETIVVPPLDMVDNVVRRALQKVMVPIEAATIIDWQLEVATLDLYFRPIFVFEFIHLDRNGNTVERKLEELDAVAGHWVNLQTIEFQRSTTPWTKVLKFSADVGSILLQDIPVVGTTMKVISSTIPTQREDVIVENRLAGDSSTDAPSPKKKKDK